MSRFNVMPRAYRTRTWLATRIAPWVSEWPPDERDYSNADLSLLYGEHPTTIEIKWRPDQPARPTNEPLTPDNHTGIKR